MRKIGNDSAGQAATELAVFGAILIFLLGTIIRTATSNSYSQNQNFKAMRMAMLASWQDSSARPGLGSPQITAHNSAQILFLEDRLSPDYNKYGDMDRTPFITSGSGSFSYNLLYPISDSQDVVNSLPVQDVWINGQHFPFTMASYVPDMPLTLNALNANPATCTAEENGGNACEANRCWRNYREWGGRSLASDGTLVSGGTVQESSFVSPSVAPITPANNCASAITYPTPALQRTCQETNNACTIFADLAPGGPAPVITQGTIPSGSTCAATGVISPLVSSSDSKTPTQIISNSTAWNAFISRYESSFPNLTALQYNTYLGAILNILQPIAQGQYKLFYTLVPNSMGSMTSSTFSATPPDCFSHPCANAELSSDVPLLDYHGNLIYGNGDGISTGNSSTTPATNVNGVMQYDLRRMGYYSASDPNPPTSPSPCTVNPAPPCLTPVATQFPLTGSSSGLRNYIAWQWGATAGTTAAMIGLNTSNNQFPTWDIDGRLKEVTIYNIQQDSTGITHVAYEDSEGGDIDGSWDKNSCGLKPGLQTAQMQIFTFTQNGTYMQINEGKLFNPETGQVVRSANQRDSVDLIQRSIQLSNNTGRFCTIACTDGSMCGGIRPGYCANGSVCTTNDTADPSHPCGSNSKDTAQCANPNPVEACVNESPCTCFMGDTSGASSGCGKTVAQTCYDTLQNVIYVRSRLQDTRGRSWLTNATGQLGIK